jgi:hypothetical protein
MGVPTAILRSTSAQPAVEGSSPSSEAAAFNKPTTPGTSNTTGSARPDKYRSNIGAAAHVGGRGIYGEKP